MAVVRAPGDMALASTSQRGSIAMQQVSKTYLSRGGEPVPALLPLDFTIRSGEFMSLVGPSGCGKTTLLLMIGGLLKSSSGEILVAGEPPRAAHPAVSVAFQKPTLLRWRTVLQNILLPAQIAGTLNAEARQRADHLLELTGLNGFRDRHPHELSGGMQQRAAIARSLVTDPGILLMDEPFAALDEFTREMLNDELLKLWDGQDKTVVFVTHNIAEAVYLSDRVAVMGSRPGRLVDVVDVSLERPRHAEQRTEPRFNDSVARIRRALESSPGPLVEEPRKAAS